MLQAEGIVFLATNRYIDLRPAEQRLASEQGVEAVPITDWPESRGGASLWTSPTDLILVTRDPELLQYPRILDVSQRIPARFDLPTFTDAAQSVLDPGIGSTCPAACILRSR